ncbi:glycosyltransferase [Paraglaciecola aquimarina]|uniref:Glycosyltransferase n=1 Tax=Paraglaciecola aquimarina TaxID=1235557 RepID=A0ABU3T168_9ALTE|nr:glycosyltransferase [Paraglaciecola aquimarina]MDU0355995.1 glycosyltransferase [Paraglaciecola aquimarina]
MEKKKVVFLLKELILDGGVEKVTANLGKAFEGFGFDVYYYVLWDDEKIVKGLYGENVIVEPRNSDNKLKKTFSALGKFKDFLVDKDIDIVISAKETANIVAFLAALNKSKTSFILTRHVDFKGSGQKLGALTLKMMYALYSMAKLSIVCVSNELANEVKAIPLVRRNKVSFVENAVFNQEVIEQGLEPLNDDNIQGDYICGVGRLKHQKGFDILMRAYSICIKAKQDIPKLVLVGDGPDHDALIKLRAELKLEDSVVFAGYTNNPYKYMKNSKLFVLSSRFEGMPTVLVEAISLGVPIVATDCPTGPSELIGHIDGVNLVPVGDHQALAAEILAKLTAPHTIDKKAVEGYEFSNAARSYLKLTEE